ncbi:MAG: hypothetical protein JW893_06575 [Candidatus Omnitrophica bacterium]|nr:hypothetical protein [Candidatus Omnitrophota bacterium]
MTDSNKKRLPKDHEKGFFLIVSYLVIATLAVFSVALFTRSFNFQNVTESNKNRIAAFNMAEAGLDQAIVQLAQVSPFQPFTSMNYPCSGGTYYSVNTATGRTDGCATSYTDFSAANSSVQGGYDIWVTDPSPNSGFRQVEVAGHVPSNGSSTIAGDCPAVSPGVRGYACQSLVAYVELDDTLFDNAVFSEGDLVLNGTSTDIDSYNSDLGVYGGSNVGENGDIASNGSFDGGEIVYNGSPDVDGEVHENMSIYCDAPSVSPGISSMGTLNKNSDYTLPDMPTNTYRYDSMTFGGNAEITISPSDGSAATVYVDGNLTIGGGSKIIIDVPVVMYVGGTIDIGGSGITNTSQIPSNLIIVSTGSGDVDVSGGVAFYGAIFAPDSDFDLSGSVEFHGAVFAADFRHNGTNNLHYDEALTDTTTPCVVVRLRSWRQKNTIASS